MSDFININRVKKQYDRGVITAEEAVQKILTIKSDSLGQLCIESNKIINDYNNEVTELIACIAKTTDINTGISVAYKYIPIDEVINRLCIAHNKRYSEFMKLLTKL